MKMLDPTALPEDAYQEAGLALVTVALTSLLYMLGLANTGV